MFRRCVERSIDRTNLFLDGFMDHDKENLRLRVNRAYKEILAEDPKVQVSNLAGIKVKEFGVNLFDACVHYCGVDQVCVT